MNKRINFNWKWISLENCCVTDTSRVLNILWFMYPCPKHMRQGIYYKVTFSVFLYITSLTVVALAFKTWSVCHQSLYLLSAHCAYKGTYYLKYKQRNFYWHPLTSMLFIVAHQSVSSITCKHMEEWTLMMSRYNKKHCDHQFYYHDKY